MTEKSEYMKTPSLILNTALTSIPGVLYMIIELVILRANTGILGAR